MSCGFIADQSPGSNRKCLWMNFLNQETPVSFGVEKYAKAYNHAVVFAHIQKVKRGKYILQYYTITSNPVEFAHGEITAIHTLVNEHIIKQVPRYWLWTHKRWKHKRPADIELYVPSEKVLQKANDIIKQINTINNW